MRKTLYGVFFFAVASIAHAQWITQNISLSTGWNSVSLKVNPENQLCANFFNGQPIEVVSWWCRSSDGEGGYTQDPDDPTPPSPEMRNWYPGNPGASTFFQMIGGESYLIKATAPAVLSVKGTPAMPVPVLFGGMANLSGLNLRNGSSVMLSEYFSYFDELAPSMPFAKVKSSDASAVITPPNMVPNANEALWVSASGGGIYTYAGPFNVELSPPGKIISFNGVVAPKTVKIHNNADIERSITINRTASSVPPAGQGGLAGPVPLMRAVIDWSGGFPRETYEDISFPFSTNIAANADFELKLLPKVASLPLSADAYQSILEISDLGSSDNVGIPGGERCLYKIGVRAEGDLAEQTQPTGLWVGNVVLDGVNRAQTRSGVSNVWDTAAIQTAYHPFTFRVILHVDEYGVTRLLKEVFLATDPVNGNYVLASRADAVNFRAQHPDAPIRRISSANFPFMAPVEITGGSFATADNQLEGSITQAHDDKTNPFVHAFHPDHDNVEFLNGTMYDKSNGATGMGDYEAWAVSRDISFTFAGNDPVGSNPKWNISETGGMYEESITGLSKTEIKTQGVFRLNKVSDVARILYVSGN